MSLDTEGQDRRYCSIFYNASDHLGVEILLGLWRNPYDYHDSYRKSFQFPASVRNTILTYSTHLNMSIFVGELGILWGLYCSLLRYGSFVAIIFSYNMESVFFPRMGLWHNRSNSSGDVSRLPVYTKTLSLMRVGNSVVLSVHPACRYLCS